MPGASFMPALNAYRSQMQASGPYGYGTPANFQMPSQSNAASPVQPTGTEGIDPSYLELLKRKFLGGQGPGATGDIPHALYGTPSGNYGTGGLFGGGTGTPPVMYTPRPPI